VDVKNTKGQTSQGWWEFQAFCFFFAAFCLFFPPFIPIKAAD
jgi:hypothetical protein